MPSDETSNSEACDLRQVIWDLERERQIAEEELANALTDEQVIEALGYIQYLREEMDAATAADGAVAASDALWS